MNERIRELAEQARKYARDYVAECKHYGHYMEHNELEVRFEEKFAELIVRECINIGDNYEEILGNEPECFNCRKVAYGIVDKIKNHFGVGE